MSRCQHCDRDIHRLPSGYWEDGDGIIVCMKLPIETVSGLASRRREASYVFHKPMPVIRPDRRER